MVTALSASTSSRNASNSSSARSISSISSTDGVVSSACRIGPGDEEAPVVERRLERVAVVGAVARGAQVQDLAREVPVVERLAGVDALVALQPDQRRRR